MRVCKILLAIACILCDQALAQEPAGGPFSLKEDIPPIGSYIKRSIATGSIPLDKSYAQLTPEQVLVFKNNYESMPPGDEPPFPLKGLGSMIRAISKGQEAYMEQGPLVLVARIDPDGNAKSVQVFSSPSEKMTRFAAAVMMLEKYKPAVCSGVPCTMDFPMRFDLKME